MSRNRSGIERGRIPRPKVQHKLFKPSGPGRRPRVDEKGQPGGGAADEGAEGQAGGPGKAAIEDFDDGGPFIKGNMPGENVS